MGVLPVLTGTFPHLRPLRALAVLVVDIATPMAADPQSAWRLECLHRTHSVPATVINNSLIVIQ